jgi:lipoate-protein ligase A
MRQWRLLCDYPMDGRSNMAIDEAILDAVCAGDAPPTLRLYAWAPACLSLGHGQPPGDADRARINALGWDAVRRPTGGKAILHADELTYSVALPADHPLAAGGILESYQRISRALMAALDGLGLPTQAERGPHGLKPTGAVCFEIPSHYEITAYGRKLIGSAQTRRKAGLLQHGSLPLSGDLGRICDALYYSTEDEREAGRAAVRARAITLSEALSREVDWPTAAEALIRGFETALGVRLSALSAALESARGGLGDTELRRAETLAATRYASIERKIDRVLAGQ